MINAKEEFLTQTGMDNVLCAQIEYVIEYSLSLVATLKCNYTQQDWEEFLSKLNFEYDNGYGTQYLFGTIWCKGTTWFTRGEYDGSEGWEYHSCPNIPQNLL